MKPGDPSSLVLGRLPTGPKSEIRVSLDHYRGTRFLNIRAWFVGRGKVWTPTKRGMTFDPPEIPHLIEALKLAIEAHAQGQERSVGSQVETGSLHARDTGVARSGGPA